jgi:hypothetical protein
MWVEDTDQQKLCKQTKLEVTDKHSTTTTTTTQTHKILQYRLLPTSKKIVQVTKA